MASLILVYTSRRTGLSQNFPDRSDRPYQRWFNRLGGKISFSTALQRGPQSWSFFLSSARHSGLIHCSDCLWRVGLIFELLAFGWSHCRLSKFRFDFKPSLRNEYRFAARTANHWGCWKLLLLAFGGWWKNRDWDAIYCPYPYFLLRSCSWSPLGYSVVTMPIHDDFDSDLKPAPPSNVDLISPEFGEIAGFGLPALCRFWVLGALGGFPPSHNTYLRTWAYKPCWTTMPYCDRYGDILYVDVHICTLERMVGVVDFRDNVAWYRFDVAGWRRKAGKSATGGCIYHVRARISIYRGDIAACYRLYGIYAVDDGYW